MLAELRIRDLAIIDALDLAFGPGLNVLTGETGAGKSIIIDAVNLLLGDRASTEVVRAGAERTEVEGMFQFRRRCGASDLFAWRSMAWRATRPICWCWRARCAPTADRLRASTAGP